MTKTDSTGRGGAPTDATDAATARATWSLSFAVVASDGVAQARSLRRLTRGDADLGQALFTTVTGPDEDGRVVLIGDDEDHLDRLTARLHALVAEAGLQLDLVVVDRRGPDAD